jgi:hypothetical protein
MAYMDFNSGFAAAQRAAEIDTPTDAPRSGFSALEWSVVALARKDTLGSLRAPGPVARALGGLFGFGGQSRLADSRLEALRRVSIQAWHRGHDLPKSEIRTFLDQGYSIDQLEALLASIGFARLSRRRGAIA